MITVHTIDTKQYVATVTTEATVKDQASDLLLAKASEAGQVAFVAIGSETTISDDKAVVVPASFKGALGGEMSTAGGDAADLAHLSGAGTYTGNNTHAGVETFNGPVVMNGEVVSAALERERCIDRLFSSFALPYWVGANSSQRYGSTGFRVNLDASKAPKCISAGVWGWYWSGHFVAQFGFYRNANAIIELSNCMFLDFKAPPAESHAYCQTLKRNGNAAGTYLSVQLDFAAKKVRIKYNPLDKDDPSPGQIAIYEFPMPAGLTDSYMARLCYFYESTRFCLFYLTSDGQINLLCALPAKNNYLIHDISVLFHTSCIVDSSAVHVDNKRLIEELRNPPASYNPAIWQRTCTSAPVQGLKLPPEGGSASLSFLQEAGTSWEVVMKPDWLQADSESWSNGATAHFSADATAESRSGRLVLGSIGNHAVTGTKAYENILVSQTVEA